MDYLVIGGNSNKQNWIKMIYTIGHKDTYDHYIENEIIVKKKVDGLVWQTYEEAEWYKILTGLYNFDIYFVDAAWEIDTVVSDDPEVAWRKLARESVLSKM